MTTMRVLNQYIPISDGKRGAESICYILRGFSTFAIPLVFRSFCIININTLDTKRKNIFHSVC